jgi:hypothetical protein
VTDLGERVGAFLFYLVWTILVICIFLPILLAVFA